MRPARPCFPFLIIPFQGEAPGSRPVPTAAGPEPVPAGKRLNEIVNAIERLRGLMETHSQKMSKVMTKIGLLESAFDEFLESSPLRGDETDELAAFFETFIPVLDNLGFLKRAVEDSGNDDWKKGMDIFYRKLFKLLSDFGIEPAAQAGMNFDPSRHESVETVVNPELSPGSVADIVLEGWTYKGRLLRFAKVIVAKEK